MLPLYVRVIFGGGVGLVPYLTWTLPVLCSTITKKRKLEIKTVYSMKKVLDY